MREPGVLARSVRFAWLMVVLLFAGQLARAQDVQADEPYLDLLLTNAHRAAIDFAAAEERKDAEAMAHAAMLRLPFDSVQVDLGDATSDLGMQTGAQMLAAARAVAQADPALLARVEEIAHPGRPTGLGAVLANRVGGIGGGQRPVEDRVGLVQALPRRPAMALPHGRRIAVPARASVQLRARLVARQSLIVYAHSRGGSAVRMSMLDGAGATLCSDAQPHGAMICRWRATAPTEITVVLDNAAAVQIPVFVSTNL